MLPRTGIGSGCPGEVSLLLLLCVILLMFCMYVGKKYSVAFCIRDMTVIHYHALGPAWAGRSTFALG